MKNKNWFTLVELIVVVTIIAILATIGFVSYSQYTMNSRDSSRITQISSIYNGLQLYSNGQKAPLPDNYITLSSSWEILTYQWTAWQNVLDVIWYRNGWVDPKTGEFFTYTLSSDGKEFELLALLEKPHTSSLSFLDFSQTFAETVTWKYPYVYGDIVWTVLNSDTGNPVNIEIMSGDIDISSSSNNYEVYTSSSDTYSWDGTIVRNILKYNGIAKKNALSYADIVPSDADDYGVTSYVCNDGRVGKFFALNLSEIFKTYSSTWDLDETEVKSWYSFSPVTPSAPAMSFDDIEYNGEFSGIVTALCTENDVNDSVNDSFYIIRENGSMYLFQYL